MGISFIRVDDRIIHGQVVTRWAMEKPCDGILAVDDKAAVNPVLKSALKSASTKKTLIFTVDEFLTRAEDAIKSDKQYFLITKDAETMYRILSSIDATLLPKVINVGPQSARANDEMFNINRNADLSMEDMLEFDALYNLGYEVDFRLVPDSSNVLWSKVRSKYIK